MAANILNNARAVQMSVFVVRAFLKMRALLGDQRNLAQKLASLEKDLKKRFDVHEAVIVTSCNPSWTSSIHRLCHRRIRNRASASNPDLRFPLNFSTSSNPPEQPEDRDDNEKLIRYFNLCAEEWLFWKAGYIYDPVWRAWENGMKQYSRDPRVVAHWQKEQKTDSYYGFEFPPTA